MAFAPDEGHVAESGGKIKPESGVKFMKFMVSRRFVTFRPGGRKREPPPSAAQASGDARRGRASWAGSGSGFSRRGGRTARLARVAHGIAGVSRAAGLGSFKVSASQEVRELPTPERRLVRAAC